MKDLIEKQNKSYWSTKDNGFVTLNNDLKFFASYYWYYYKIISRIDSSDHQIQCLVIEDSELSMNIVYTRNKRWIIYIV